MGDGKQCVRCGTANKADARYCRRCGEPLPTALQRRQHKEVRSERGHLFDRTRESLVARACLVVLILGALLVFFSQSAISQASNYSWASYFVEDYEEAMANNYLMSMVGIIMAIGGGVGLIQYFVRTR